MKIIAKSLAILIVLLAGSLTLTGQESIRFQDAPALMAIATNISPDVFIGTEKNTMNHLNITEDRLMVENWMTNWESWRSGEKESEPELMEWMLQVSKPADIGISELIRVEPEAPIRLEKWMYCCTDWKIVSM